MFICLCWVWREKNAYLQISRKNTIMRDRKLVAREFVTLFG